MAMIDIVELLEARLPNMRLNTFCVRVDCGEFVHAPKILDGEVLPKDHAS